MFLIVTLFFCQAAEPAKSKTAGAFDSLSRQAERQAGPGSGRVPVKPASAEELFEKLKRIELESGKIDDKIAELRKGRAEDQRKKLEHEKVKRSERPPPQFGDPLFHATKARVTAYDPDLAIKSLIISIFRSDKMIAELIHDKDGLKREAILTESQLERFRGGPYVIFGKIPLGGDIGQVEKARKVTAEPAEFNATYGRVGQKADTIPSDIDDAVLRAIFPLLVDVYEIEAFEGPELVKEFRKFRLLVEHRTGVIFAITAAWSASGTEAVVLAPEMAKRTREILTVLQANYPAFTLDKDRVRDAADQFLSVRVTNERTGADGRRIEAGKADLRDLKKGETPPANSVFLTYTLKSVEKRVIDSLLRIETRHAVGGIEALKKKGSGL